MFKELRIVLEIRLLFIFISKIYFSFIIRNLVDDSNKQGATEIHAIMLITIYGPLGGKSTVN